ncbi:neurogenic locus notch homolog protein 1-like [Dendronephthya gigantea]|uniref:neurogenic locus notch homolog protein 1-like n=1 Tax=Dendronephthya gigantea TaxID=151771 RepID=UPI00106A9EE3|nr:neurogenic locus notch homolog protein 1-like [Dendronephthya gigantea]
MSKPCLNGKCNNTQPGFSCSCFAGYTGQRCEIEIDECADNPCFLGVSCTDLVASFKCGPCPTGYTGDGENCTRVDGKNQPPKFDTPSLVYAILNKDFEILLNAEDDERHDLKFVLLSNGTFATAEITKRMLKISNVTKNGTVYIQVEDKMGAKSLLRLQVFVMKCPCKHDGECYQKQNVTYPVLPTDYYCQCHEQFSGSLCELRRNPCDKLPCFPGLQCSQDQNSDGYSCEQCPPLFEGDGKQCKREETEDQSTVRSEMKLTNRKWDEQLNIKTSMVYKNLESRLTVEIRDVYRSYAGFSYVLIERFRKGSIIVAFALIFSEKKVKDPLKPLKEAAETGKLGNTTFQIYAAKDEKQPGSGDDEILGIDETIFYVIVGVAVFLVLLIILAIYYCVKRKHKFKKAELKKKVFITSNNNARGIVFRQTDARVEGSVGEELDLKVFDNKVIRFDEEIKIQL